MLTQTSVTAIQTLLYIVQSNNDTPVAPGHIATLLDASPSYLAKINTDLAKADILRAHRGKHGGVTLSRPPENISLLEIVEACQGKVLADYCASHDDLDSVCAFHAAMADLQNAIVTSLSKWTLADLAARPGPVPELAPHVNCRMACALHQPE